MTLKQENLLHLSQRLSGVSESTTLQLNAAVQSMKAKGLDVINLTAGEPDFWVPDVAKEAAIKAVQANCSKYTPVTGILELREAITQKTNQQQSWIGQTHPWKASDVVVTNGAKQALFNSFLALLDSGDEVLIPSPYWLSYPDMVKIAGGIPKLIKSSYSQGFKINPSQLKSALGPKVKILILNSPNNPTGAMYTRDEFAALADILIHAPQAQGVWVVSDEIYDRITLDNTPFCSFLEAAPELAHRTITVNGMSKGAAMTGWRIGWSVAPKIVTEGMAILQGQSTSGINALAQWASLAALGLPDQYFLSQAKNFTKRRNLMLENLKKASKLELSVPDGAFYFFIGVQAYLKSGEDSISFCKNLLEKAKVAVVPGVVFGEPKFVRVSFSTDEKTILEGCQRIVQYLESLKTWG